jgi:hypothetical protein
MAGWKQKPSVTTLQERSYETFTPERPTVLICDDHTSHIAVGLTESAKKKKKKKRE